MLFQIARLDDLKVVVDAILSNYSEEKIFCFYGNLGAGKTTLIKEICERLQVVDVIASPTYPIINEYKTNDNKVVYHIDLYRLKNLDEAINIGIEDYLYADNYCFIEWPDNFESILPDKHIKIKMTKLEDDIRNIEIIKNN
ncbi:MAG: tRNA (adenosine(37)-N6)-threonylcarbamoyltransferase complex ATPase subunit type 1 TsaE [Chitinophagales bacterium]